MAKIHISEIQDILAQKGAEDAKPNPNSEYFLEIRFDASELDAKVVDEELQNQTITADCPYRMVTTQFDKYGQLKSLDLSYSGSRC